MQIPVEDIRLLADYWTGSDNNFGQRGARVLSWLDSLTKPEPAKVRPRAGQVWQKLNVGTKTASKAPRFTVVAVFERTVSVRFPGGTVRTMRTATLQADWHCLNPES